MVEVPSRARWGGHSTRGASTCDMKRGFGLCIYFALRPTTYNLYACGVLEGPGSE
jgi:hypothetical protein